MTRRRKRSRKRAGVLVDLAKQFDDEAIADACVMLDAAGELTRAAIDKLRALAVRYAARR